MHFDNFHPIAANWFKNQYPYATPIQQHGWPAIKANEHTLIAAPTGSGKTMAGFFSAIDSLYQEAANGFLEDELRVVYVSPLKALSNDIEKNLRLPLKGIKDAFEASGTKVNEVKAAVRTGDTPQSARTAMIKRPPHILVTTPESLYLLLTSKNGRKMLSTVRTLIVDEIHALIGDKRGSHFSLSVERLENLVQHPLQRIGISATQRPIEMVVDFLCGVQPHDLEHKEDKQLVSETDIEVRKYKRCTIINAGHSRELDLQLEVPPSPLTAVMSNEVWGELYERLEVLIKEHKTTVIFVNTRRTAERMSFNLKERLGEDVVTAHHGSMSKEHRYDAEQRLKEGKLQALVATASMELGIDIGHVDLVCQISSPKSIAAFLQRVGRSGHSVEGKPKGRLFPQSLDELVECTAIMDAVRRKELDKIVMPEAPLDILAQQIVAEVAGVEEVIETKLFQSFTRSYPFRAVKRERFAEIVQMLADGYTTRRGRQSAYLHRDIINGKIKPRKNARLTALINGGAIPDTFEFDIVLEPENIKVGTLDEEFASESLPGDIFQLGNNSWQVIRVDGGKVRVADAKGQPPTMPFWFGEAPGRTRELSESVSRLREVISEKIHLTDVEADLLLRNDAIEFPTPEKKAAQHLVPKWKEAALSWLVEEVGVCSSAADQMVNYLASGKAALGLMPTRERIVIERFFDQVGDMHVVVHAPFGSRVNRAWGLSLRKKFCRKFNFELQAAATEDALIMSLGSTHSFPLDEVFRYLHPSTVKNTLTQALLDAPMFGVRWRWNASRALAVQRRVGGRKVPPQFQRMAAEDLVALVFPDSLACLENIPGDREVPEHPLVQQTIHDCLTEPMDIDELTEILEKIVNDKVELIAKDLREPSPLAHEIINARPHAFLDEDDEFIERRTNAVRTRSYHHPGEALDLTQLSEEALQKVTAEAWPLVRDTDELHDALILATYFTEEECLEHNFHYLMEQLEQEKRAFWVQVSDGHKILVGTERWPMLQSAVDKLTPLASFKLPKGVLDLVVIPDSPEACLIEVVRGRLQILGPIMVHDIADSLGLTASKVHQALLMLESDGFVFRGHFDQTNAVEQWCERRLLQRIHRYSIQQLRNQVKPISGAEYMRFLFQWHHLSDASKPEGSSALKDILEKLEGFEAQAASWESDILSVRMHEYDFAWLDNLCLSGKFIWGRLKRPNVSSDDKPMMSPIKTTPILFSKRGNIELWGSYPIRSVEQDVVLSHEAQRLLEVFQTRGACFFDELSQHTKTLPSQTEQALSELVANGKVTADSFTGLRALLMPVKYSSQGLRRRKKHVFNMEEAGRWSEIVSRNENVLNNIEKHKRSKEEREMHKQQVLKYWDDVETVAKVLLRRYGIVFRQIIDREQHLPPWRDMLRIYRTLEARGEVRGGRFVEGMYGEQYALPEVLVTLKRLSKKALGNQAVAISAADPLNLVGIVSPGKKVSAIHSNRILYIDGMPVAAKEGKDIHFYKAADEAQKWQWQKLLVTRELPPKLRAYLK